MSLRKSAASGVRWATVSMVGSAFVEVMRLVVLARLLSPNAFGLMAMMSMVIGFGQIFSQMGLVQTVIQRPESSEDELVSLYWLNVASGGVVYFVLIIASPIVCRIYSLPELHSMLPFLGCIFLINPFGDLYRAMLEKNLQFKCLAYVDLSGALVGLFLTVLLAFCGFGVWSLIWGQLVTVLCCNIGVFFLGQQVFRPRFHFRRCDLQGYLRFGMYHVGAMCVNYVNSRMDQLLIGMFLGPQALGYYSMAFNLIMGPVQRINPILTRVAFPVLAKVQGDNERLKRGYFKMLNMLTSVNAPLLIGMASVAPLAIPLILGEKWLPIVPVCQILALYSLVRSAGNAGGSMVLAKGRFDTELHWNLLLFSFIPFVVFLSAYFGNLLTVAWAMFGLQIFLYFIWYVLVVQKILGPCFFGYIKAVVTPLAFSVFMGCSILLLNRCLFLNINFFSLVFLVCLGVAIYFSLYVVFDRNSLEEKFLLLLNKYE